MNERETGHECGRILQQALSSPKPHSDVRGGEGGEWGEGMVVSCDEAIVLKRQAHCLNPVLGGRPTA